MKNEKIVKAMVGSLVATSLVASGASYGIAADMPGENVPTSKDETKFAPKVKSAKDIKKSESVYVEIDNSGKVNKVDVTDWLQSGTYTGKITDRSRLKNIENIKGDEKPSVSGDKITWDATGKDIYYTGTTDKKLPVGMEISYKLNGKEVKADDLLGKSGSLEIHIKYKNNTSEQIEVDGEKETVSVPFLMLTGMILPSEHFTNVTIDNGKTLSEGDNTIVLAYGLPGVRDSLDILGMNFGSISDKVDDKIDKINDKLSDEVTIKADVKDFQISETYTYASNDVFNDIDIEKAKGIKDVEDKIDELEDAMDKLIDGADKVEEGAGELDDKFGDFREGIAKLKNGGADLKKGTGDLKDGIYKYVTGNNKLLNGVKTYAKGAKTLGVGARSYAKNTQKLVDGIGQTKDGSATLSKGAAEFGTNLDKFSTTLQKSLDPSSMTGLADGIDTFHGGVVSLQGGMGEFSKGITKLDGGLQSVNDGVGELKQGNTKLKGAVSQVKEGIDGENGLKAGAKSLEKGIEGVTESVGKLNQGAKQLTQ
ncbi:MAG: hypothetical protein K6G63_08510, partial [Eubacterium sp.]|nr:hypothetical protein [Eubacterium sp.]